MKTEKGKNNGRTPLARRGKKARQTAQKKVKLACEEDAVPNRESSITNTKKEK